VVLGKTRSNTFTSPLQKSFFYPTTRVKVNTAVWVVNLNANSIGYAGCAALVEALRVNTAVKQVYLRFNSISDAGRAALFVVVET
jgi:hypothetical protein